MRLEPMNSRVKQKQKTTQKPKQPDRTVTEKEVKDIYRRLDSLRSSIDLVRGKVDRVSAKMGAFESEKMKDMQTHLQMMWQRLITLTEVSIYVRTKHPNDVALVHTVLIDAIDNSDSWWRKTISWTLGEWHEYALKVGRGES